MIFAKGKRNGGRKFAREREREMFSLFYEGKSWRNVTKESLRRDVGHENTNEPTNEITSFALFENNENE